MENITSDPTPKGNKVVPPLNLALLPQPANKTEVQNIGGPLTYESSEITVTSNGS